MEINPIDKKIAEIEFFDTMLKKTIKVLVEKNTNSKKWHQYFKNCCIMEAFIQVLKIYDQVEDIRSTIPTNQNKGAFELTRIDVEALYEYIQNNKNLTIEQFSSTYGYDTEQKPKLLKNQEQN